MLILDARKPKTCNDCDIRDTGRVCTKWNSLFMIPGAFESRVAEGCPVKGELPKNHGPLKDADVMLDMLKRTCAPDELTYTIALGYLEQIIKTAPTVVEAEYNKEEES